MARPPRRKGWEQIVVPPPPLAPQIVTMIAASAICGMTIVLGWSAVWSGGVQPKDRRLVVVLTIVAVMCGALILQTALQLVGVERQRAVRLSFRLRTIEFEGFCRPGWSRFIPRLTTDYTPWRLSYDDVLALHTRIYPAKGRSVRLIYVSTPSGLMVLGNANAAPALDTVASRLGAIADANLQQPGGEARATAAPRPMPAWAVVALWLIFLIGIVSCGVLIYERI